MGWVNRGPLGLGNWITDEEGRQVAVTYGERVNPKSAEDTALIVAAPDLLAELDCRVGDLVMLRRAIDEGDPKAELLFRIDDMLRETRAVIAKVTPSQGA